MSNSSQPRYTEHEILSRPIPRRMFGLMTGGMVIATSTVALYGQEPANANPAQDSPAAANPPPAAPTGPTEATWERDYDAPGFKPSWKKPQINRTMLQDFVIFAHSDLEMVKKLLEREPGLINGSIDWGGGDFETALGGASHMGRRDIVEFLLSSGARIDLFCAAMLGMTDVVKTFLTFQPNLIDAKGPHGFSLHFHAQVGGDDSAAVLEYLQSVKKIELRPVPFLKGKK